MKGSMGWIGVAALVGQAACSYTNPNFDDGSADTGASTDGTSQGSVSTTSSGPSSGPPGDGPGTITTGATATDATTATTMTSTDPTEGPSETTDGPMACEFGPVMGIHVPPEVNDAGCFENTVLTLTVLESSNANTYNVRECLTCGCSMGPQYAITFDLAPPELTIGECYGLELDLASIMGECVAVAYEISDEGGGPIQLVSNVANPDLQDGFVLGLGEAPLEPCETTCPAAGYYELVAADQPPVPPDDTPVSFGEGRDVYNRGSGRGENCLEHYRWYVTWGN
ncbi:MAG: hypothetical protein KDK70_00705 [Myxococcales bacterium]|nr:hypothetical protein [Myxococcales bacterium]